MGKLIVLEGTDGTGKSTQFDLLLQRLELEGTALRHVRFPRYDQPSSALIRMYLNGAFGSDPDAVNAYAASTFYAVDRYASLSRTGARITAPAISFCATATPPPTPSTRAARCRPRSVRHFSIGSTTWNMAAWDCQSRIGAPFGHAHVAL